MDFELIEKLPKGVSPSECLVCHNNILPFVRIIRTQGHNKIYSAVCVDCSQQVGEAVAKVSGLRSS